MQNYNFDKYFILEKSLQAFLQIVKENTRSKQSSVTILHK